MCKFSEMVKNIVRKQKKLSPIKFTKIFDFEAVFKVF